MGCFIVLNEQLLSKYRKLRRDPKISRMTRWIMLLAGAPLAVVILFLAIPVIGDRPAPRFTSVAFLGYTNDALAGQLAQFSITNISDYQIVCSPIGIEVQTTNSNQKFPHWSWTGPGRTNILKPHQAMTMSVKPPTNGIPWRFAVFSTKPMTLRQAVSKRFEKQLPDRVYHLLSGDLRRTHYSVTSVFEASGGNTIKSQN